MYKNIIPAFWLFAFYYALVSSLDFSDRTKSNSLQVGEDCIAVGTVTDMPHYPSPIILDESLNFSSVSIPKFRTDFFKTHGDLFKSKLYAWTVWDGVFLNYPEIIEINYSIKDLIFPFHSFW